MELVLNGAIVGGLAGGVSVTACRCCWSSPLATTYGTLWGAAIGATIGGVAYNKQMIMKSAQNVAVQSEIYVPTD